MRGIDQAARGEDEHDYGVDFRETKAWLPGFAYKWNVRRSAEQLLLIFQVIQLSRGQYTRLKQTQDLIAAKPIDARIHWT
jgi:hypothetical protein